MSLDTQTAHASRWKHFIRAETLLARTAGQPQIAIGLIDGPVDRRHPDLSALDIRGATEHGSVTCQRTRSEACQHGTFVAGILAAKRGSPAPAIAPQCRVISHVLFCESDKVEQCPLVTPGQLADALLEILGQGVRIVNLSLGLANAQRPELARLMSAYDQARERGVLLVGAAGNQGAQGVNPLFDHDWVLPVAACDLDGQLMPGSNSGATLAQRGLLAPGMGITSTAAGGGYTQLSGTSVAAPFLTGVLALLSSLYPHAEAGQLREAVLAAAPRQREGTPPVLDADRSLALLELGMDTFRTRKKDVMKMEAQASLEPTAATAPAVAARHENADMPLPPLRTFSNLSRVAPAGESSTADSVTPAGCACAGVPKGFAYSIGEIKPVFPNTGLYKEFLSIASNPNDYYTVFSNPKYSYITQLMCWVLEINNVDVFVVKPRSALELRDLVESLGPVKNTGGQPSSNRGERYQTLIIGTRNGMSVPSQCNGLTLPLVTANQVFYFTYSELINQIEGLKIKDPQIINELLQKLLAKPNTGTTDAERALNFVAVRNPEVYKRYMALREEGGHVLISVRTERAASGGNRSIINVIFENQQEDTGEQKFLYTGVDVTDQFPFINTKLREYIPGL